MTSSSPRWRPLRSVRTRILATMLLVAATGMLVAGATAYLVQRERLLAAIDERLSSAVDDVSVVVSETPGVTIDQALSEIVQRVRPGTNESAFALTTSGTALVPGGELSFELERDAAFVDRIVNEVASNRTVRGTAQTSELVVRYVAIPIAAEGTVDRGIFIIAVDLEAALDPLTEAFRTFAIVAAVSLLVVGVVGWSVSGRLLAPIRRLRETATRITATDLSERIEVTGTDDVSDLTVTVNGMLDRLDSALTGQRQLLDDVGHELKTPLTIVRGHLELLDPARPDDVAGTRALVLDELDRMSGLVRDIADLSQTQRSLRLSIETTDVSVLLERVRVKAIALSPAVTWSTAVSPGLLADIDPERITQALLQLAANAVTHAAGARSVQLSAEVRGERLLLRVSDDGVGIPPELQSVVFERFRRVGTGRGAAGSGLGLAIVAAIAAAHDGQARIEPSPRGATVVLDVARFTAQEVRDS